MIFWVRVRVRGLVMGPGAPGALDLTVKLIWS